MNIHYLIQVHRFAEHSQTLNLSVKNSWQIHEHDCSVGKVNTNWFTNKYGGIKKEISNCSERKI